jgi:hypothetical protein
LQRSLESPYLPAIEERVYQSPTSCRREGFYDFGEY